MAKLPDLGPRVCYDCGSDCCTITRPVNVNSGEVTHSLDPGAPECPNCGETELISLKEWERRLREDAEYPSNWRDEEQG